MKSIKLKLVFLYIALVFMVMIVSGTIMILRVKYTELATIEEELEKVAILTKENVIDKSTDHGQFADAIKTIYNIGVTQVSEQTEVFIFTAKKNYIASSVDDAYFIPSNKLNPVMNGEKVFVSGSRFVDKNGYQKTWCEFGYPVYDTDNKQQYIIYTRTSMDRITDSQNVMAGTIILSSIVALFLTAIVGSVIADTFTAPILRLTNKSEAIAQGDLYQIIEVKSDDEIGQLTSSFNYMAKELATTIETIESEKNKLEVLLFNMTDGVLAFDVNGQLIHANSISYELLGIDENPDLTFDTVTNILQIKLNDLTNYDDLTIKEFTVSIKDKYVNAIFSIYANKHNKVEGVIIVLQDFTKHKKLDNMRKEFVANVSHEIRTPITTVKGYAETLLDTPDIEDNMRNEFLSVILSESDRITLLVKDLLELSRFDNQQLKMDIAKVDLIGIIKETIILNKLSADKKQQTIVFNPIIADIYIQADHGRIVQVITNIIGNAIKYSVKPGQITITINENPNYFVVNIKDTGMGIPDEDIERIFERFYRVDKARSRQMGGTGLGLAIAKEIMDLHNGSITVTSKLLEGTNIELKFDKNFSSDDNIDGEMELP